MKNTVSGFSKWTKNEKVAWIATTYFENPAEASQIIKQYWNSDLDIQQLHDEFIENTISNFYLPLGVAPNFLINNKLYTIPMVIEESSVVAAAAKAAKFWATRGGFKAVVLDTEKIGQVHFTFSGNATDLELFFERIKPRFFEDCQLITHNMQKRGGGILDIQLQNKTNQMAHYYQLHATFDTKDSMGANFINSCLEQFSKTLLSEFQSDDQVNSNNNTLDVIMSILSNYVPNCIVRAEVSCAVANLAEKNIDNPQEFAEKFVQAVQIAEIEPFRAVTHNKGIMNGIDAVVLATGNDFRAVEAGVHAFACKKGQYASLSHATIEDGIFRFWLEIPLALGTVGGLTSLHPLVKLAHTMLENPSAQELMQIVAVAGLAQNFAALKSLTTTGIQAGHMKMHLNNILNQFETTVEERKIIKTYFAKNAISHAAVVALINEIRTKK